MHRIDEEDYGGHHELLADGMPLALGMFMVRPWCEGLTTMFFSGCMRFGATGIICLLQTARLCSEEQVVRMVSGHSDRVHTGLSEADVRRLFS